MKREIVTRLPINTAASGLRCGSRCPWMTHNFPAECRVFGLLETDSRGYLRHLHCMESES